MEAIMKKFMFCLVLLLSLSANATVLVEDISEVSDWGIRNLVESWKESNIQTTDQYSSVYKFPKTTVIQKQDIEDLMSNEYVLDIQVNEYSATDKIEVSAFELAYEMFTADPYIDNEDLSDLGKVLNPMMTILEQKEEYQIYKVYTSGEFSGSHTSVIFISKSTNEVLVLTAGYSE
jgi:hypothetical protein